MACIEMAFNTGIGLAAKALFSHFEGPYRMKIIMPMFCTGLKLRGSTSCIFRMEAHPIAQQKAAC